MTLNSSITQSVVSVTMTGFALSAFAIDIHAVSDFGDYVIDNGTSVRFVQVDDSLQNNDFYNHTSRAWKRSCCDEA